MPVSGNRETKMRYEMTIGLHVADQELYAAYRVAMMPLLKAAGGEFRFDCEVARVLKGGDPASAAGINRLFVIGFPSREAKEGFFSDPNYLEIRARFFVNAVASTTIIAEYELPLEEVDGSLT